TVEGGGGYRKIGEMLEDTDRRFPGAVWSFSIGWGCDKLITAAAFDGGSRVHHNLAGVRCNGMCHLEIHRQFAARFPG
ncbi:hypothetical protein C6A85_12360, partial [Mycobacterium sp. ITM-2017-0098]